LNDLCQAYALGLQEQRPVTEGRPAVPHYTVTAAVIQRDGQVLIAQRPSNGLLGGMWEFPGGKIKPSEDLVDCLRREIREELDVEIEVNDQLGVYRHAYTHFRVTLHAFRCHLLQGEPRQLYHSALSWASLPDLPSYPMGKIDRTIASHLAEQTEH
jgi:A/G-specific adenine glycosylase